MQTFDTITDARNGIYDYAIANLPAVAIGNSTLADRFRELRGSPSPVDQIVRIGELLYAHIEAVDTGAKNLAGGLVAYATINAWHGLTIDGRGDGIVQAVRRDLGETPPAGGSWPAASADPAPLAEFVAPPETAQAAAAPAPAAG